MLLAVQCEVSTVSDDLGCHAICWFWSTVFSEVHSQCSHLPGNFIALHEPHRESVKRKMRDTRPNNADDLKTAINATWASITPEQCHSPTASMPRRIDAVIHAKGGPILSA